MRCGLFLITPKDGSDRYIALSLDVEASIVLADDRPQEEVDLLEECRFSELCDRRKHWLKELDEGRL